MNPDVLISELNTSVADPLDRIKVNEFIEGLLKAGSFISMLENKKINTTNLFLLLLEKKDYQDFFVEITASESFREAILTMLYLHPTLVKSKFTKSYIRKVNNGKSTNRARKTFV
jgi:hypothetical protein